MGIIRRGFILSAFILFPVGIAAQPTGSSIEKIAVLPFSVNSKVTFTDYSKVPYREININDEVKEFITNHLITQLTKSQLFTVVERSRIELIMKEQVLSLTGLLDENSAVELGKLLAADKLLYGVIEHVGTLSSELSVTVSVKLVDVGSGQIVAATTAKSYASGGGRKSNIFVALEGTVFRIMTDLFKIGIAVAQKSGSEVIINAGRNYGIKSGMAFKAFSNKGELIDPITGKSLGREQSESGKVVIREVHDTWSKGKIVRGRYSIEVGDFLERTGKRRSSAMSVSVSASTGPLSTEVNTNGPIVVLNKEKTDTLFIADYSDFDAPEILNTLNVSVAWSDIRMTGYGIEVKFLVSNNYWAIEGIGRKQFGIIPEYLYIYWGVGGGFFNYSQNFNHFPEYLKDETGVETSDRTVRAIGFMGKVLLGGRIVLLGGLEIFSEVGYRNAVIDSWADTYDTGKKDEDDKPIYKRIDVPGSYLAIEEVNLSQPFLSFGLIVHY